MIFRILVVVMLKCDTLLNSKFWNTCVIVKTTVRKKFSFFLTNFFDKISNLVNNRIKCGEHSDMLQTYRVQHRRQVLPFSGVVWSPSCDVKLKIVFFLTFFDRFEKWKSKKLIPTKNKIFPTNFNMVSSGPVSFIANATVVIELGVVDSYGSSRLRAL